jgi:hypothetical protein
MNNQRLLTLLTLTLAILSGTTACNQPAEDPKTVAERYWSYLQNGNIKEAQKLVSSSSDQSLTSHTDRVTPNTQINTGESITTVSTTITTTNPATNFTYSETFNTTLIFEQGQWKVDLPQSSIPPAPTAREEQIQHMADELSDSMQENIESIDEALDQGLLLFNETMEEGSKEMSGSLLKLLNELNRSMKDSIEAMKQRRKEQQKQEQHQQTPKPDPSKGEGMI